MSEPTPQSMRILRRDLLKGAAAVGMGVAASPVSASASLQANSRLGIGFVGVGGRGSALFGEFTKIKNAGANIEFTAICDVWDRRTQDRVRDTGGRAKGYRDYRELIADKSVDAVVIATPDHWHSKIAIEAMRAGKDVYCEKPITLYWQQARDVAKCSADTKRVLQCGAGSGSDGRWWTIRDIVKEGGIGPLVWVQGGAFRNDPSGDWNWPIQPCKPGEDLDWDMWLGHKFKLAPNRAYDTERYSRFRKFWDYSGGLATDLLYHGYAHLAFAFDHAFPYRVAAGGGQPVHNLANDKREVPTLFTFQADFPDQCSCLMVATQECEDGLSDMVRGQKAVITADGPKVIIKPQKPFAKEMLDLANRLECYKGAEVITHKEGDRTVLDEIRVASRYQFDHFRNWLECINTRQQPTLNADRAYRVMIPIALSVMSYRQGRAIYFDPKREMVVDYDPMSSKERT